MSQFNRGIKSFLILFTQTIMPGVFVFIILLNADIAHTENPDTHHYTGSKSCRECHEKFYQLWSTSFHGLAMQPFSEELAKSKLTPQKKQIAVGEYQYCAEIGGNAGYVVEAGPSGKRKYQIEHAMGGKNVYYFLTTLEKGRLQTLPIAYDVHKKEWFDTAASGIRHASGQESEETFHWKEWPYTFNTSCHGCHVSQLTTNYDFTNDTYSTTWTEPGINCETCHGPCDEHIRVCQKAPKGTVPKDLKTIRGGRSFTAAQNNDACSTCHAKAGALTDGFMPGNRFFDHFDLVTLENADYYPDGRDLGENYTLTSWLMSPCVKSGELSCLHCHTSSGRYRQKKDPNQSCRPCHQERVENSTAHTFHKDDSPGNQCITCHMPVTTFARMNRSDHSMLPPTPAATIAFNSPNACNNNGCHSDKDSKWADGTVRKWHAKDYQAPVLYRAGLIDRARKGDWSQISDMLEYIVNPDGDEVFTASLIRLLPGSHGQKVGTALLAVTKDPSPLVRSAAIEGLARMPSREAFQFLVEATRDDYRLVRVRAAAALADYSDLSVGSHYREQVGKANDEYFTSLLSRPDLWTSHYNMGNYQLSRGELTAAIASYDTALGFEPKAVMAMVNASIAYAQMGQNDKVEKSLQKALKAAPDNGAANFNMGLLKAEQKEGTAAEHYLREALKADPTLAQAAYNLCVMLADGRIDEAIGFCRIANEIEPDDPKYAYTLAFYLNRKGEKDEARNVLNALVKRYPGYRDAQALLIELSDNNDE